MQLTRPKATGVAAISLLFLLLLNSSVFAFAATHGAGSGTVAKALDGGSSTTTTTTNSTSTQSEDNQTQGGDQNQNETQPQNQSGNDTQTGDNVQNDSSGLQNDLNLTGTNGLDFALVPASSSFNGTGHVSLQFEGLDVQVELEIENAQPNANYTFVLIVNGTSHPLGSVITDDEGEGELEAGYSLTSPGTYSFGVSLLNGTTPAIVGSPATQMATLSATGSHEGDQGDNQNGNQNQQQGDSVAVVQLDQSQLNQLSQAQLNNQIPGTVLFNGLSTAVSVNDKSFSLGAGTLPGNRLLIRVLSSGAVGSRVLLINLARELDLANHGLLMTLNGNRMAPASSFDQVLSTTSASQPSYLVIATSTGYALLVSLPQLASHSASILLTITNAAEGFFQVSGLAMLTSMLTIGVAVTAIYARRKVYSPLL